MSSPISQRLAEIAQMPVPNPFLIIFVIIGLYSFKFFISSIGSWERRVANLYAQTSPSWVRASFTQISYFLAFLFVCFYKYQGCVELYFGKYTETMPPWLQSSFGNLTRSFECLGITNIVTGIRLRLKRKYTRSVCLPQVRGTALIISQNKRSLIYNLPGSALYTKKNFVPFLISL